MGVLSPEDQERYHQEMALIARLFGTPAAVIRRSLADFRNYFAAQLAGETITVTDRRGRWLPSSSSRLCLRRYACSFPLTG